MTEALTIYAVRRADGKWMRSTGYGGGGLHWVDDVNDAKLYTKLPQARGRVTFWANAHPNGEPPVIVAFSMPLDTATVMHETERVADAKMRKATEKAERARREARERLREAEETIKRAEAEIKAIRSGCA